MRKYTRRVFASSLEKYTSKRTRTKTEDTRLGEKCILCVIFLVCVIYYENALCKFSRKAVTQHCARIGFYQPLRICCKYERFRKIEAIFVNKKNSSQIGISLKSHIFTSPCSSIETAVSRECEEASMLNFFRVCQRLISLFTKKIQLSTETNKTFMGKAANFKKVFSLSSYKSWFALSGCLNLFWRQNFYYAGKIGLP